MPGFPFPAVGRLGLTSPPYQPEHPDHRYYCQLRLPNVHLKLVRSSLSSPDTLFTRLLRYFLSDSPTSWGTLVRARSFTIRTVAPNRIFKETFGPPQFPSYPFKHMLWSKTPAVTCLLAVSHSGLLPSVPLDAVGFLPDNGIILLTATIHFSGLNTGPVLLVRPASDARCRVCLSQIPIPFGADFTTDLVANLWSGGTCSASAHPLGNTIEFHPSFRESQRLGLCWARQVFCSLLLGYF
jgi:hypothetical protein